MDIDLLNPNHEALLNKWNRVISDTNDIHTWTSPLELSWLCEYVQGKKRCLEIGSHSGRSAKCVLLANPTLKIVSFDTWDDVNSFETYHHNLLPEIHAGRVEFFRGPSQKTLLEMADVPSTPLFDCCFIDGGHEDHLVTADIKGVIPLMKPRSLISGHDLWPVEKNDVWHGVTAALGTDFQNPVGSIWTHQL